MASFATARLQHAPDQSPLAPAPPGPDQQGGQRHRKHHDPPDESPIHRAWASTSSWSIQATAPAGVGIVLA
jgi:hypothetical protein